jgi:hypothetical protein
MKTVSVACLIAVWMIAVVGCEKENPTPARPTAAKKQDSPPARYQPTKSLLQAATEGDVQQVEARLVGGAYVNAEDPSGNTPLHLAVSRGHNSIVELLIARGADVKARNYTLDTPLHCAARDGYTDLAALLVAKGADVSARSGSGATPLFLAATHGHKGMVEFLIGRGSDVNITTYGGTSAVSSAMEKGYTEVADLLRAHGAQAETAPIPPESRRPTAGTENSTGDSGDSHDPVNEREREVTTVWGNVISHLGDLECLNEAANNGRPNSPDSKGRGVSAIIFALIFDANGALRRVNDDDRDLSRNHYVGLQYEVDFTKRSWNLSAYDNQHLGREIYSCRGVMGSPLKNAASEAVLTSYRYDPDFLDGRFPKSAEVYRQGNLVARAEAVRRITTSSPFQMEVRETHFDGSGKATYVGTILFALADRGRFGQAVNETAVSGAKVQQLFTRWGSRRYGGY